MGWLRQLKESYWQPSQVDQLDNKLEPLRQNDTSAAQQSPIERFVEVERDLGRLTLVMQALVEACVRKGLLTHDEISEIIGDVDLSQPSDARWGVAATERPSMPLAMLSNSHAADAPSPGSSVGVIDDFENAESWGNDDEPTEVEGEAAIATSDGGFDFGGADIDSHSAIDVGNESSEGGVATIPRTAPFPKPKKRQKSSAMRQVIGMALSGVIGLGMGYFILLWFTGQDIIKAAPMLPKWMVPAQFHADAQVAPTTTSMKNDPIANAPLGQQQTPMASKDFGSIEGAGKNGGRNSGVVAKPAQDELGMLQEPAAGTGGNEPTAYIAPTDDPLAPSVSIAPPVISPTPSQKTPKASDEPEVSVPSPFDAPVTAESTPEKTPPVEDSPKTPAPEKSNTPFEPKVFVVKDAVAVDGETLGKAVAAANGASIDLKAGELTDSAARKTKVEAYQKFCELAKAVTFVDGDPSEESLERRLLSADAAAKLAAEEEASFKDVAEIAHQWLFKLTPDRRPTSGVFLTGIIKDVQPAGELKVAMIDLGGDRMVSVVTPTDADVLATDRVAVLGVIVEDPATELTGYEGPEGKAVWSEHVIKAEAPITPLE